MKDKLIQSNSKVIIIIEEFSLINSHSINKTLEFNIKNKDKNKKLTLKNNIIKER